MHMSSVIFMQRKLRSSRDAWLHFNGECVNTLPKSYSYIHIVRLHPSWKIRENSCKWTQNGGKNSNKLKAWGYANSECPASGFWVLCRNLLSSRSSGSNPAGIPCKYPVHKNKETTTGEPNLLYAAQKKRKQRKPKAVGVEGATAWQTQVRISCQKGLRTRTRTSNQKQDIKLFLSWIFSAFSVGVAT